MVAAAAAVVAAAAGGEVAATEAAGEVAAVGGVAEAFDIHNFWLDARRTAVAMGGREAVTHRGGAGAGEAQSDQWVSDVTGGFERSLCRPLVLNARGDCWFYTSLYDLSWSNSLRRRRRCA